MSLTIHPTIPLLSDTAGDLADKYGVPTPQEEAEPTTRYKKNEKVKKNVKNVLSSWQG